MQPFTKKHIISTLGFIALILIVATITKQASAATIDIGTIIHGTTFGNTVSGPFSDQFSLHIPENQTIGTVAINAHCNNNGQLCPSITFTSVKLVDVVSDSTRHLSITNNAGYSSFVGIWNDLKAGQYRLDVNGIVNPDGSTGSYNGNWTYTTSAVPLPPSLLLFAASLFGLHKLNRKRG
jgi:hypothetical protein